MSKILVTGGAGYIGSHVCLNLLEKNNKLIILDSLSNSTEKSIKNICVHLKKKDINSDALISFYKGDIRDYFFLKNIFENEFNKKEKISAVIHLAGLKSNIESFREPIKYWDINVCGSITLLKVMQLFKCHTFIYSGSAAIYDPTEKIPYKENSNLSPSSPYGFTKLAVEQVLSDLFNNSDQNLKIAILRYFNPIGIHSSKCLRENPTTNFSNIFPYIKKIINSKNGTLKIFGKDWPTLDGTCIRDFIHVMDLVDGHIKALEYLNKMDKELIKVNLGTGKGISILKLKETFEKVNNCQIPFEFCERRKGDNPISIADNSLAKKLFNWEPNKNLELMCKDALL